MRYPQFTFLQFSDIHLDSKMASSRLNLPATKREERKDELLATFCKAVMLGKDRKVDAIIIPGDLFDFEFTAVGTVQTAIEVMESVGNIPIIIAPGNHDFYSPDSYYSRDSLLARGMKVWPDNVYIFSSPEFTVFNHPLREDVCFIGRAFDGSVPVEERILSKKIPIDSTKDYNILTFHGSLDGYTGLDSHWKGKITAPFSVSELNSLGMTYCAVGHYHKCTELKNDEGRLIGAYSGCLVSRGLDEIDEHCVLYGYIDHREEDNAQVYLEKIEVDPRRIVRKSVQLDGIGDLALEAKLAADLPESVAGNSDIVYLTLTGRRLVGCDAKRVAMRLYERFYHLVVEDETVPDYDLESVDLKTAEGKFIQAIRNLKESESEWKALSGDLDIDLDDDIIEDALYYGLDALRQNKVILRHAD